MKHNILTKGLIICALFAFANNVYADVVTEKTRWVFGKTPTLTNSYDKAWTVLEDGVALDNFPQGNGVTYTINDLTIYRGSNKEKPVIQYYNRLYDYKSLYFSFQVDNPGTLTIEAHAWQDNDSEESGKRSASRTYPVKVNGITYSIEIPSNEDIGNIEIPDISGTATITIEKPSGTVSYYSIMWEPSGVYTPADLPTMNASEILTSAGASVSTLEYGALGLKTNNSVNMSGKLKVVNNNADVTGNGTFTYSPYNLTMSGSTVSSSTATTEGTIDVSWWPNNYTNYSLLDLTTFTSDWGGNQAYDASTKTLTFTDYGGRGKYYNFDEAPQVGKYTHAVFEVEPLTSSIKVVAMYYPNDDSGVPQNTTENNTSNQMVFNAGATIIYVPLYPDRKLSQIAISGYTEGSHTVKIVNGLFGTGTVLPARTEINNIIVSAGTVTPTINVTANTDLTVGDTETITVQYMDGDSQVSGLSTTYSSNTPSVATVATDGTITAVGPGSATITVSTPGAGAYSAASTTIKVNVLPALVTTEVMHYGGSNAAQALSTLGGNTFRLKTNEPDGALLTGEVGVYARNGDAVAYISGSDTQSTYTTNSEIKTDWIDGKPYVQPNGHVTSTGVLNVDWMPASTTLTYTGTTTDDGVTYNSTTKVVTFPGGDQRFGWNFLNGSTGKALTGYKYIAVPIESNDAQVTIAAEYLALDESNNPISDGNGGYRTTFNYVNIPVGQHYLYVPIYPDRQLAAVKFVRYSAGTITLRGEPQLVNSDNLPAYGSITGIVVEDNRGTLTLTVDPESITIEVGQTSDAIVVTNDKGLDLTYTWTTSGSEGHFTLDATTHQVTGIGAGQGEVVISFAGNDDYNPSSVIVPVTVTKKTLTLTVTPATSTIKVGNTVDLVPVYTSDGETVTGLKTTYTSDTKSVANARTNYPTVTGYSAGSATITCSFAGNEEYNAVSQTVTVTVTANPAFAYPGENLTGDMTGTLKNDGGTDLCRWKFGAPEETDIWVYKLNTKTNDYQYIKDPLKLKDDDHTSEEAIDDFSATKLTANGGGGDSFTEFNGMMGGYLTEEGGRYAPLATDQVVGGGRYLTPIGGTFVRVEPIYDGVVTIRLRHNGGVDTSAIETKKEDGEDVKVNFRWARRPLYVIDENGAVMKRATNYEAVAAGTADITTIDGTYAYIAPDSKIKDVIDMVNDKYTAWFANPTAANDAELRLGKNFDHDFSKNAFDFTRRIIYNDVPLADFNSRVRKGFVQKLFYSATNADITYQATEVGSATNFFAKYGYEALSATHLKISFPVKGGKTYFVGANKSKVGLCTIQFEQTQTAFPTTTKTLPEAYGSIRGTTYSATDLDWLTDGTVSTGEHINVKVVRTFKPGHWHPLVLPFSVSESYLREKFGQNVTVIALDGNLRNISSKSNYATCDSYDGGHPDPSEPFINMLIKTPAIHDESVTFTKHYYQMIYANCPVFICPDPALTDDIVDPVFENVTFVQPELNAKNEIVYPYTVDDEIGDGTEYKYRMVATYHPTTKAENAARNMYYLSNSGGTSNVATLYHASAGNAPAMKGMRVWIEPKADNFSAPLRKISMNTFWGEEIANGAEESGIVDIIADEPWEWQTSDDNVYDVSGRIVGHGTTDGLTPGLYIFKGRKIYVK